MTKNICNKCGGEVKMYGSNSLGIFEIQTGDQAWILYEDYRYRKRGDYLCLDCIYKALKKHFGEE